MVAAFCRTAVGGRLLYRAPRWPPSVPRPSVAAFCSAALGGRLLYLAPRWPPSVARPSVAAMGEGPHPNASAGRMHPHASSGAAPSPYELNALNTQGVAGPAPTVRDEGLSVPTGPDHARSASESKSSSTPGTGREKSINGGKIWL